MIGNAVKVMRIVTGEEQEDFPADDGKDKAAQSLGRRGGRACARKLLAVKRGSKSPAAPLRRVGRIRNDG